MLPPCQCTKVCLGVLDAGVCLCEGVCMSVSAPLSTCRGWGHSSKPGFLPPWCLQSIICDSTPRSNPHFCEQLQVAIAFSPPRSTIYLFYFWLCWVFVAARGLSLVAMGKDYSFLHCTGFSLWWLLLLQSMGSRCVGFSSCDMWAQ